MHAYGYSILDPVDADGVKQMLAITSFCRDRKIELEMVFMDDYESSFENFFRRPAASKLIEVAKVKPVNYLVVYELSRLGRTPLDTLNVVTTLADTHDRSMPKLQILSVKEEFMNLADPSERDKLIKVIKWFSEQERKRIKERQQIAWNKGKQKGRPRLIDAEELIEYVKKYPGLSMAGIVRIINGDRIREGKKPLGYSTIRNLAKKVGVRWRLILPQQSTEKEEMRKS